ncbi:MAG: hypothetical protein GYB31_02800 [Bacteroidetes bacterium]|nr:hypothetical protein [Bacteroidota bacterium]
MKETDPTNQLKRIKKVSAPPFLFTRIEAKIEAREKNRLPISWAFGGSLALGILLCLNIFLIINSSEPNHQNNQINSVADALELNTSNQLYYE